MSNFIVKRQNRQEQFYSVELVDIFSEVMNICEDNYYKYLNGSDRTKMLLDFVKTVEQHIDTLDVGDYYQYRDDNELDDTPLIRYDDDWYY
jgi:hypothetical protein